MRSFITRPLSSPWRVPAAAAALVTAAVHVSQFGSTWQENRLAGAGFIALAVACGAGALALAAFDTPLTWLLAAGTCLMATAGYIVSRTIGLPGMAGDIGNWAEPAGIAAVVSQFAVIVAALITAASRGGSFPAKAWPGRPAGHHA